MQLQLYIDTVQQILSHTCRWTPRPARGVPEGSKRSISPKTDKTSKEAYEWWDGKQREDGERRLLPQCPCSAQEEVAELMGGEEPSNSKPGPTERFVSRQLQLLCGRMAADGRVDVCLVMKATRPMLG